MRIFYITPRVPYPIDKGDKLRAFYQIKYLSAEHKIFLFAIDENNVFDPIDNPLNHYCERIQVARLSRGKILFNLLNGIFKSRPFQTSFYYSTKTAKEIFKAIEDFKPDLIFCQLIRTGDFVENIYNTPKIIDYVDAISKGLERRLKKSNLFLRFLFKWELKRAIKYEEIVFHKFNERIIITNEDRDLLPFREKAEVKVIPNGIDLEFFYPIESEKKCDILFSGNLSYPPNINAAEFLVKKIMPIVWQNNSNVTVNIAGAAPKKRVLSLASKKVNIIGWTDDIRENYKVAKIFIAPLQIGTGLQNKLLQAMAMKLPCVVSGLTAKGITNKDCDFMLIANSPEEYSLHINKLLNDKKYSDYIAEMGYNFVRNTFDWKKIIADLNEIVKNTRI